MSNVSTQCEGTPQVKTHKFLMTRQAKEYTRKNDQGLNCSEMETFTAKQRIALTSINKMQGSHSQELMFDKMADPQHGSLEGHCSIPPTWSFALGKEYKLTIAKTFHTLELSLEERTACSLFFLRSRRTGYSVQGGTWSSYTVIRHIEIGTSLSRRSIRPRRSCTSASCAHRPLEINATSFGKVSKVYGT